MNETDNSNSYKIEKIEGTPLTKIYDGKNWKGTLGLQVVTPDYKTEKELIQYINKKSWTMIMAVIIAMKTIDKENKKLNLNN